MTPEPTLFDLVGGEPTFVALVDRFYAHIAADERLSTMFPADLEPGKRWQRLFLMQFFGGHTQYGAERGHPRLRMRHMPFVIDQEARERWLHHMLTAVDEVGIQEPMRTTMREYFTRASEHMINQYAPAETPAQEGS